MEHFPPVVGGAEVVEMMSLNSMTTSSICSCPQLWGCEGTKEGVVIYLSRYWKEY